MSAGEDHGADGFLSRWSRRKLAVAEDGAPEGAAPPSIDDQPPAAQEDLQEDLEPLSDAEVLEKLNLPDPDHMKPGDDFSAFMNGAVPTRLRNRALRKLWLSNAALANLDELLEYGEDFTDAATVVENLQTAYQVGRGFIVDPPEDESEQEPGEEQAVEAADGAAAPDQASPDRISGEPANGPQQLEETAELAADAALPEVAHATPPPIDPREAPVSTAPPLFQKPRRMRFVLPDQGEAG